MKTVTTVLFDRQVTAALEPIERAIPVASPLPTREDENA